MSQQLFWILMKPYMSRHMTRNNNTEASYFVHIYVYAPSIFIYAYLCEHIFYFEPTNYIVAIVLLHDKLTTYFRVCLQQTNKVVCSFLYPGASLNTRISARFCLRSHDLIWRAQVICKYRHRNFVENICRLEVNVQAANGLISLGAKTTSSTVFWLKFPPRVHKRFGTGKAKF